jgi:molybdopterin-guanine dinucleotide biosynthesis protein A
MPFLTEPFLRHLVERGQTGVGPRSEPGTTTSVIPRTTRGYEPLCAIYARESAVPIRARLDRGERQAALPPDGVQVIEVGPEELAAYDPHGLLFVNVNTPHDYAQARRRVDSAALRPLENPQGRPEQGRGATGAGPGTE